MKKVIVALALASAACAAPAFAGDVGLAISIGEPGFYGQLVLGDWDRPQLVNSRPVLEARGYGWASPVYLRVPDAQRRSWGRNCARYDACARPVYFVRDDWYRDVYAPRYGRDHDRDRYDNRGNDRRNDGGRDWRSDHGHDRRSDRGHDRNDYRGNDRRNSRGHEGGGNHDRGRDGGRERDDNRNRGHGGH